MTDKQKEIINNYSKQEAWDAIMEARKITGKPITITAMKGIYNPPFWRIKFDGNKFDNEDIVIAVRDLFEHILRVKGI